MLHVRRYIFCQMSLIYNQHSSDLALAALAEQIVSNSTPSGIRSEHLYVTALLQIHGTNRTSNQCSTNILH